MRKLKNQLGLERAFDMNVQFCLGHRLQHLAQLFVQHVFSTMDRVVWFTRQQCSACGDATGPAPPFPPRLQALPGMDTRAPPPGNFVHYLFDF
nr:hypothetical protein [uncultured Massilia sp.]